MFNRSKAWHKDKSEREILEALVESAVILLDRTDSIMATLADVQTAQATLDSDIASMAQRVLDAVKAAGSGGGVSAADLDTVVGAINASSTSVNAVAPVGGTVLHPAGVPEVDSTGHPILDANGVQLIGVPVLDANGQPVLDVAGNPIYDAVPATTTPAVVYTGGNAPSAGMSALGSTEAFGPTVPSATVVQAPDVIQKLP
jgi:hypothetical protein